MSNLGEEIDLLKKYPKSKRNLEQRSHEKTPLVREVARKFGKDFFDGDRKYGYGGFNYNSKFWTEVVKDFIDYYKLSNESSILDVGCAKGFMIYDFKKALPGATFSGVDISQYAIDNSIEEVRDMLTVSCASELPFKDSSFDLVISINTIHNLDETLCAKSLKEIQRVTKKNSFITVDAYNNEEEKKE